MYRYGHYGAALLVFAPLGFALTAAGHPGTALVLGVVLVGLTPLPDVDHRVPLVDHRGVTHTLAFALLVGVAVGGVGLLVGQAGGPAGVAGSSGSAGAATGSIDGAVVLGLLGFAGGTLSVLAHLAADAVTPMGIAPLWPASSRRYSLDLVRAANPLANYLLLAVGVGAAAGGLYAGSLLSGT